MAQEKGKILFGLPWKEQPGALGALAGRRPAAPEHLRFIRQDRKSGISLGKPEGSARGHSEPDYFKNTCISNKLQAELARLPPYCKISLQKNTYLPYVKDNNPKHLGGRGSDWGPRVTSPRLFSCLDLCLYKQHTTSCTGHISHLGLRNTTLSKNREI